jgi:hypothetical protein
LTTKILDDHKDVPFFLFLRERKNLSNVRNSGNYFMFSEGGKKEKEERKRRKRREEREEKKREREERREEGEESPEVCQKLGCQPEFLGTGDLEKEIAPRSRLTPRLFHRKRCSV